MAALYIYAKFIERLAKKEISLSADTFKMMLMSGSYTPNLDTDDTKAGIVANELSTAGGYTAGGATLGSVALTLIAANSWAVSRANSTAYALGDIVRPASGNGHLYRCVTAGTSAGSLPTYPTVSGMTVTDGSVVWAECGTAALQWDAADVSWSSATFTARYAPIYDDTHASDVLCFLYDPGANMSPVASTLLIPFPANGIWVFTTN